MKQGINWRHRSASRQSKIVLWDVLEHRRLMSAAGFLAITGGSYATAGLPAQVTLFDSTGKVESSYSGIITINATSATSGDGEAGWSATAVNGVATFSSTFGDLAGYLANGSILTANDDLGDRSSLSLSIQPPPATRAQIVVVQQPTLDPATGSFSVVIGVEDASGNLVPNDPTNPAVGEALPAWISINTGPTGALISGNWQDSPNEGTSLGDGTHRQPATLNPDGTQTFSGIKVSQAGTYKFEISDGTPVASVVTGSVTLPASSVSAPTTPTSPTATAPPIEIISPTAGAAPLTKKQELAQLRKQRKQELLAARTARIAKIEAARQLRIEKLLAIRQARLAAIHAKQAAVKNTLTNLT